MGDDSSCATTWCAERIPIMPVTLPQSVKTLLLDKAYGHVVMRVRIDPNTFPDWCAAHGTSPGREGRKRFVAAAVTDRYGNQD